MSDKIQIAIVLAAICGLLVLSYRMGYRDGWWSATSLWMECHRPIEAAK